MSEPRPPADDSPLYAAQKQREEADKRRRQPAKPGQSPPDAVDEASDESFPASDPPAWTETTASKDDERA